MMVVVVVVVDHIVPPLRGGESLVVSTVECFVRSEIRSVVYEFEEGCLLWLVRQSSKSFFNRLFLGFPKAEIISPRD